MEVRLVQGHAVSLERMGNSHAGLSHSKWMLLTTAQGQRKWPLIQVNRGTWQVEPWGVLDPVGWGIGDLSHDPDSAQGKSPVCLGEKGWHRWGVVLNIPGGAAPALGYHLQWDFLASSSSSSFIQNLLGCKFSQLRGHPALAPALVSGRC